MDMKQLVEKCLSILEGLSSAKAIYLDTNKVPRDIFMQFEKGDNTKTKKYLDWMCREYVMDSSRPGHIVDVVRLYDNYAQRNLIPQEYKDIYKYGLNEIDTKLGELGDVKSKTEIEKEVKSNIEKVFENDKVLIVSPKTFEASCYYGANTKWCTAAKNREKWDSYASRGVKLYYIVFKEDNVKVAIAISIDGTKEVRDSLDNNVPYLGIAKKLKAAGVNLK